MVSVSLLEVVILALEHTHTHTSHTKSFLFVNLIFCRASSYRKEKWQRNILNTEGDWNRNETLWFKMISSLSFKFLIFSNDIRFVIFKSVTDDWRCFLDMTSNHGCRCYFCSIFVYVWSKMLDVCLCALVNCAKSTRQTNIYTIWFLTSKETKKKISYVNSHFSRKNNGEQKKWM